MDKAMTDDEFKRLRLELLNRADYRSFLSAREFNSLCDAEFKEEMSKYTQPEGSPYHEACGGFVPIRPQKRRSDVVYFIRKDSLNVFAGIMAVLTIVLMGFLTYKFPY